MAEAALASDPLASPPPAAVSLQAVEKTYGDQQTGVRALAPVTLALRAGETTSVVGPSGCGKSTLLRMIAGIDQPSRGRITYGGETPRSGRTGIVFQRDLLLDWRNVLGNVLLPAEIQGLNRRAARARAEELLRELGLDGFQTKHPWELSGGMRQRVAIARALLPRPALLLLDEPFSALDAITRDQMNVLMQHVQEVERTTTLLITHSIAEAVFMSERVIVMSGRPGRVLDDIAITFPRPRHLALREETGFTEIVRRIRVRFEQEGVLAR